MQIFSSLCVDRSVRKVVVGWKVGVWLSSWWCCCSNRAGACCSTYRSTSRGRGTRRDDILPTGAIAPPYC